jgi:hypothetical protein
MPLRVRFRTGKYKPRYAKKSGTYVAQEIVHRFDPVPYRQRCDALEVGLTADIGGEDGLRFVSRERRNFVVAQLVGKIGLQYRVGAGGAAAQMRVGNRCEFKTQFRKQRFDHAFFLQAVLQRAGGVKGYTVREA